MCEIIATVNQKGGLGKTTNTINLGAGLTRLGKKVLIVDEDPQANATTGLGFKKDHKQSLAALLTQVMMETDPDMREAILKHKEGMELISANAMLEKLELMIGTFSSESPDAVYLMKKLMDQLRDDYDYILIDCRPTLSSLVINALAAADSVLIPTQTENYAVEGLQELIKTVSYVKKAYNPNLMIKGIIYTMDKAGTNQSKAYKSRITELYGNHIHIFRTSIPNRVAISEAVNYAESIFAYAEHERNAVPCAECFMNLTREVISLG